MGERVHPACKKHLTNGQKTASTCVVGPEAKIKDQIDLPPVRTEGLHGHASDWYRQNGFVAEAVHHALRVGDHDRAAEIVEENAWSMVLRADLGTLRSWIQTLPDDTVSARPWLRIYYAWALVFGESEAAEAQLQAVEQQQTGKNTTLPAEMQGHITAVRAWIALPIFVLPGALAPTNRPRQARSISTSSTLEGSRV